MNERIQIPITDALERDYAHMNCWQTHVQNSREHCNQRGPSHGFCTLKPGHSGIHIAHNYSLAASYGPAEMRKIYAAWADVDPDLYTDEGL